MTAFFTCIILIGSGITLFAFILMLFEKKRLHDYRTDLREKKEDLIRVIEDAEELISEMNRFSEYTVTQIEEKHDALQRTIAEADLRIGIMNSINMNEISGCSPLYADEPSPSQYYDESAVSQILNEEKPETGAAAQRRSKVLTFDLKRREIIKLAKSGLDCTEIARLLNCGKGEIELISRMAGNSR